MMKYNHAEAFCLMTYRSDDGSETETLWNSRDGVTPFVITLRSGKQAQHVDWHNDQCNPKYIPPVGSRVFVDLTLERAREYARDTLNAHASYCAEFLDVIPSEDELAEAYCTEGAPDIITVTPEWLSHFLATRILGVRSSR